VRTYENIQDPKLRNYLEWFEPQISDKKLLYMNRDVRSLNYINPELGIIPKWNEIVELQNKANLNYVLPRINFKLNTWLRMLSTKEVVRAFAALVEHTAEFDFSLYKSLEGKKREDISDLIPKLGDDPLSELIKIPRSNRSRFLVMNGEGQLVESPKDSRFVFGETVTQIEVEETESDDIVAKKINGEEPITSRSPQDHITKLSDDFLSSAAGITREHIDFYRERYKKADQWSTPTYSYLGPENQEIIVTLALIKRHINTRPHEFLDSLQVASLVGALDVVKDMMKDDRIEDLAHLAKLVRRYFRKAMEGKRPNEQRKSK